MNRFTLGVALASLAAGGAAYALEAPEAGQPMGDRGGIVTRADAEARAGAMFDKLDANRDGKLDQADRAADEAKMFDRIDSDHNGQISRTEFAAFHHRRPDAGHGPMPMGMGGESKGPDGHEGRGRHHMRVHHGRHGGGMMMGRMADANGDGSVTRAEFIAAGLLRFDAADADHDGRLSPAERQAARRAMGQRMREGRHDPGARPSPSASTSAPR